MKLRTSNIERRTPNVEGNAAAALTLTFDGAFRGRCVRRDLRRFRAFSLIEIIVVVGIIALLASLIFPVAMTVSKTRKLSTAKAELGELQTAIEAYKSKFGSYPPDNPGNAVINQLYYELLGTTRTAKAYTSLDNSIQVQIANIPVDYGPKVSGFMNASANSTNSDEGSAAVNFLRSGLRPNQVAQLIFGPNNSINILVCSVPWEHPNPTNVVVPSPPAPPYPKINPWRYVSTSPTNNSSTYDLWVDLYVRGRIYRVNNWSKEPQLINP